MQLVRLDKRNSFGHYEPLHRKDIQQFSVFFFDMTTTSNMSNLAFQHGQLVRKQMRRGL